MANKAGFHPYGITIPTPDGDVILNAGNNMTILPQGNFVTFSADFPKSITSINGLTGDVNLVAGPGITLNITGNNITIQTGDSYVTEVGFDTYVTEDGLDTYVVE